MEYELKLNKAKKQVEGSIYEVRSCTAIKVIVGLDGYDYKYYTRVKKSPWSGVATAGVNVHIAMNGPLMLTFAELDTFQRTLDGLVSEAREILEGLNG